jgi:hypothetical protein
MRQLTTAHLEVIAIGTAGVCLCDAFGVNREHLFSANGERSRENHTAVELILSAFADLLVVSRHLETVSVSSASALGVLVSRSPCPASLRHVLDTLERYPRPLSLHCERRPTLERACEARLRTGGAVAWETWTLLERISLDSLENRIGLAQLKRECGRELSSALAMTRSEFGRFQPLSDRSSASVREEVRSEGGYSAWQEEQPTAFRDGVG